MLLLTVVHKILSYADEDWQIPTYNVNWKK